MGNFRRLKFKLHARVLLAYLIYPKGSYCQIKMNRSSLKKISQALLVAWPILFSMMAVEARVLTAKDNGGNIFLARGERLVITLAENPATGYLWEIDFLNEEFWRRKGKEFLRQTGL